MSHENRFSQIDPVPSCWRGPSEPEIHDEHRAALDATVFQAARDVPEIVLELEAGELRVRRSRGA